MLKIGEFSKLTQVSVRMLRHYDEIGLLKPAEIDCFTDYRYYKEEQLFSLHGGHSVHGVRQWGFIVFQLGNIPRL